MKIEKLEPVVVKVNARGDWVFIKIHTDAGITGLGEASHSKDDRLLLTILEQMAQKLVGRDPLQIQPLRRAVRQSHAGWVAETAWSGVEQALWDVMGQHLGVPIRTLLGGALREKLRLYANINRHVTDRTPQGFAAAARQAVREGFRAIKIAPFDELVHPDRPRTGSQAPWRLGAERVRAVRDAIGLDIELAVDCHCRMELSEALLVADDLADAGLFWLEEPVAETLPTDLKCVATKVPMPTAAGERLCGLDGFRNLLLDRVVDILMPDVKHVGGIMELKRVADAALLCDLLVSPHNPSGPVATTASAQVAATLSNFYILEYAWGEVDWRADLLDPPEKIEGGYLILPESPGLGHRLNPKTVAAHRV